jgi:hypothetical protein
MTTKSLTLNIFEGLINARQPDITAIYWQCHNSDNATERIAPFERGPKLPLEERLQSDTIRVLAFAGDRDFPGLGPGLLLGILGYKKCRGVPLCPGVLLQLCIEAGTDGLAIVHGLLLLLANGLLQGLAIDILGVGALGGPIPRGVMDCPTHLLIQGGLAPPAPNIATLSAYRGSPLGRHDGWLGSPVTCLAMLGSPVAFSRDDGYRMNNAVEASEKKAPKKATTSKWQACVKTSVDSSGDS